MKPYYEDGGITIYHGDWRDVLPGLPSPPTAIIADPPYGMAWRTDTSRFTKPGKAGLRPIVGDDAPFDPSPWLEYPKVVLWGANHFASRLPVGTTLVWLKRGDAAFGSFLSDAELAWMKGGHGVYAFRLVPNPMMKAREGGGTIPHPSQKPIALMRWCIEKAKCTATDLILDPFMGSGTTLVAAKGLGIRAIGVEIEERYCDIAAKRMEQEMLFPAEMAT